MMCAAHQTSTHKTKRYYQLFLYSHKATNFTTQVPEQHLFRHENQIIHFFIMKIRTLNSRARGSEETRPVYRKFCKGTRRRRNITFPQKIYTIASE